MKAAQLYGSRAKSLKDQLFQTIRDVKLQSVPNLLKSTRKREHSSHHYRSQHSSLKYTFGSPNKQTHQSAPRYSFSPPSYSVSRPAAHHSNEDLHRKIQRPFKKPEKITFVSKNLQNQNYHLWNTKKDNHKSGKKGKSISRQKSSKKERQMEKNSFKSRSKQSKSKDSKLNLSSILEQESSESKLMTPSSRPQKSRYRRRKFSGSQTKKKDRRGIKEVVWRRLERCLKYPQKYHHILKSDIINIRFRVLRKKLLEVQVIIGKELQSMQITLHKGNIECQGIQEHFSILKPNSIFSLYSSIRSIDLGEPFRLPKLQIETSINKQKRFQKVITLPYCWLHMAQQSQIRQVQRSRIKTKACLEDMVCSKSSLKGLIGVLPGWGCQMIRRGQWMWQSHFMVGEQEFQVRILQNDGYFMGQISGRGQQRLIPMLQFLEQLLS